MWHQLGAAWAGALPPEEWTRPCWQGTGVWFWTALEGGRGGQTSGQGRKNVGTVTELSTPCAASGFSAVLTWAYALTDPAWRRICDLLLRA